MWAASFSIHFKRLRRPILYMVAVVLAALSFGIGAASLARQLLTSPDFGGVSLAVVDESQDKEIGKMLRLFGDMSGIGEYASFIFTDSTQAVELVKDGYASAVLVLPEGFLESLMTGENLSPKLMVNTARPMEALVVSVLADSAMRMVVSTQNGIGLTIELVELTGQQEDLSQAVNGGNRAFALWVLNRGHMFVSGEVSPVGMLSVPEHYLLGMVLYFVLLSAPVLHPIFCLDRQRGWIGRIQSTGNSLRQYILTLILAGTLPFTIMLGGLLAGISLIGGAFGLTVGFSFSMIGGVLAAAVFLSAFSFLCCNTGRILPATGLTFLLASTGLFLSGGLLPQVFMPAALVKIIPYNPITWLRGVLSGLFGKPFLWDNFVWLSATATIVIIIELLVFGRAGRVADNGTEASE